MAEPELSGATGPPPRGLDRPPVLVVAVESEDQARWLAAIDYARAGVRPVYYRVAAEVPAAAASAATRVLAPMRAQRAGAGGAEPALPDFTAIVEGLAEDRPVACFVAEGGPLARLVAVAADLAQLPVLYLVTAGEELESFGRREKPRPDLYFLADEELLPEASLDPRYGATLLPTGHPGDSPAAGERISNAIRDWRSGALPAAAPELSIVVPAYKEEGNIELVCDRLLAMLEQDGLNAEILLVDDASPDATYRVARAQMLRSPRIRAFSKPPPRGMAGSDAGPRRAATTSVIRASRPSIATGANAANGSSRNRERSGGDAHRGGLNTPEPECIDQAFAERRAQAGFRLDVAMINVHHRMAYKA